jgi:hypothetical protein
MSPNQQPSGYNPARLTTSEIRAVANIFKDFLADSPLITVSIIAAGIGGALEGLHILWLAYLWVHGRL